MHAARDFAAGLELLDRGVRRGRDDLSVVVDHHADHGVVNLRADFNAVERGSTTSHVTEMTSGKNLGSRFGFKGTEDLGNGVTVGFILENGFSADTGSLPANGKFFDRESTLYLEGAFGNLKFGRMTRRAGSTGSSCIYAGNIAPISTGYGDSISGYNAIMAGNLLRYDNVFMYSTPDFAGLKLYVQYSGGYALEEGEVENKSTANRYYGLGMTNKNAGLTGCPHFFEARS